MKKLSHMRNKLLFKFLYLYRSQKLLIGTSRKWKKINQKIKTCPKPFQGKVRGSKIAYEWYLILRMFLTKILNKISIDKLRETDSRTIIMFRIFGSLSSAEETNKGVNLKNSCKLKKWKSVEETHKAFLHLCICIGSKNILSSSSPRKSKNYEFQKQRSSLNCNQLM